MSTHSAPGLAREEELVDEPVRRIRGEQLPQPKGTALCLSGGGGIRLIGNRESGIESGASLTGTPRSCLQLIADS